MAARREPAGLNTQPRGPILDRFVAPGQADAEDTLRSRVLVGASFALFVVCLSLGITRLALGGAQRLLAPVLLLAALLFFLAPFVLRRTANRRIAGGMIIATALPLLLAIAWREDGVNAPAVIWFPLLPVLAGYLIGVRAAVLTALAMIAGLFAVDTWLTLGEPTENGARALKTISASLAAVFGATLAWLFEIGRKRYVAALRDSEMKSESMLAAMPDAMFIVDRNGVIESARLPAAPGAASVARMSSVANADLVEFLGRDNSERLGAQLADSGAGVELYDVVIDGRQQTFELRLAAAGGDMLLALLRDVTREHEVERLKEEFLSTVSHELRTPLTAVRGALGLIEGSHRESLPTQAGELVDVANRNTERLAVLVNDLLDLRQVESGRMTFTAEAADADQLAESACGLNNALAVAYGVTLAIGETSAGACVLVDPARMQQVLTNLVSNAVKHSNDGQQVTLFTRLDGDDVLFGVEDDGLGIPERFRKYVFDKFSQADSSDTRVQAGTGLGLSICREFVEAMGGRIWFEAKDSGGTIFYAAFRRVDT